MVTSPPYNLGVRYADWNDNLKFDEYTAFCKDWLSECYRLLVSGGRLCLNIPFFTYKNGMNLLFEYLSLLPIVEWHLLKQTYCSNVSDIPSLAFSTKDMVLDAA